MPRLDADLPQERVAAACPVRDDRGRVRLVEPAEHDAHVIPALARRRSPSLGGATTVYLEEGEPPA